MEDVRAPIITVASDKGGVGKTMLSIELSAQLGAVLVDLDPGRGGATDRLGVDVEAVRASSLLLALESAADGQRSPRLPRPKRAPARPSLIASHPDLRHLSSRIDGAFIAEALLDWAARLTVPALVVDTRPGDEGALTLGAIQAADVVVVPVVLERSSLRAAEAFVGDLAAQGDAAHVVVVPNKVGLAGAGRMDQAQRLVALADLPNVAVSPPIGWWPRQLHNPILSVALSLRTRRGRQAEAARQELVEVSRVVRRAVTERSASAVAA